MKTIRARIGGIAPLLLLLLPVGLAWAGDKPTITIEVVDTRAWTKDVPIHHSGSSESSTDCNTNGTINDSNVSATTNCNTSTTTNPSYTGHIYLQQESVHAILPGGQHVTLWCQNGFRKCFDLAAGTYEAELDGDKALRLYVHSLTTHKLMGKIKYRIVAGGW